MSRVRLLKPTLNDDIMCGKDSVIDMRDEGRVKYFVDMGQVERVAESESLTVLPPPVAPPRKVTVDETGQAIGQAILKILNMPKDDQDAA
jgi:hypothetical protein